MEKRLQRPRTRTGMMLGKFLPPHEGHVFLGRFAENYVDDLTILVCTLAREPIPGDLRFAWMKELFPNSHVVHVTDDLPQKPEEHPDFWEIWREVVRRFIPEGPDCVFASEDYGWKLAGVLGSRFIPVDIPRVTFPVSGEAVRNDPMTNWRFIPPPVRPYFVKRVCVYGPESTGKTTLTADLAAHFNTVHAIEYARPLLDPKGGTCDPEDIPLIALGQKASEDALARLADRVIFCDTDLLTTSVWSEILFGHCPDWLLAEARARHYDLYLLLDVDVPWIDDSQRFFPIQRREMFKRFQSALDREKRPYVIISGTWEARFEQAKSAVENLIK